MCASETVGFAVFVGCKTVGNIEMVGSIDLRNNKRKVALAKGVKCIGSPLTQFAKFRYKIEWLLTAAQLRCALNLHFSNAKSRFFS